ncbi:MAG TPA: hypothetical protein VFH31_05465 [Pyrinomonadaceae bacterium]|nr:hypothetical protein [Pyrinomonadaceae bacterium]
MNENTGSVDTGTPAATQAAGNESGANAGAWYESIADQELRGFVQNRGWKDPGSLADSYRNLEKLTGVPADQILKLPKEDDVEGWGKVYDRLGRPQTPDGYQLPVPDGVPQDFAKAASAKFHELGLPAKQAQELTKWWNEQNASMAENMAMQREQQAEADMGELKREWGQKFDAEVETGRRAVRQFGIDPETLGKIEDSIGTAALMKMFNKIGKGLGEASFEGGDRGNSQPQFGVSKDAAMQRISELKQDQAWTAKYLSGDVNAKAEMDRLMSIAYGN